MRRSYLSCIQRAQNPCGISSIPLLVSNVLQRPRHSIQNEFNQVQRPIFRTVVSSAYLLQQRSHYAVLGVSSTASSSEVRAAFAKLVKRLHPDAKGSQTVYTTGGHDEFVQLVSSYEILRDPGRRNDYDREISGTGGSSQSRHQRQQRRHPAPHEHRDPFGYERNRAQDEASYGYSDPWGPDSSQDRGIPREPPSRTTPGGDFGLGGDWARAAQMDREADAHAEREGSAFEARGAHGDRQSQAGTGHGQGGMGSGSTYEGGRGRTRERRSWRQYEEDTRKHGAGGSPAGGPGDLLGLLDDVAAALGPDAVRHLLRPEVLRARAAVDPDGVWARLLHLYEGKGRGFDPHGSAFEAWNRHRSGFRDASRSELDGSREAFSEVWPRSVSLEERTRPGRTNDLLHVCVGRRTIGVVRGRSIPRLEAHGGMENTRQIGQGVGGNATLAVTSSSAKGPKSPLKDNGSVAGQQGVSAGSGNSNGFSSSQSPSGSRDGRADHQEAKKATSAGEEMPMEWVDDDFWKAAQAWRRAASSASFVEGGAAYAEGGSASSSVGGTSTSLVAGRYDRLDFHFLGRVVASAVMVGDGGGVFSSAARDLDGAGRASEPEIGEADGDETKMEMEMENQSGQDPTTGESGVFANRLQSDEMNDGEDRAIRTRSRAEPLDPAFVSQDVDVNFRSAGGPGWEAAFTAPQRDYVLLLEHSPIDGRERPMAVLLPGEWIGPSFVRPVVGCDSEGYPLRTDAETDRNSVADRSQEIGGSSLHSDSDSNNSDLDQSIQSQESNSVDFKGPEEDTGAAAGSHTKASASTDTSRTSNSFDGVSRREAVRDGGRDADEVRTTSRLHDSPRAAAGIAIRGSEARQPIGGSGNAPGRVGGSAADPSFDPSIGGLTVSQRLPAWFRGSQLAIRQRYGIGREADAMQAKAMRGMEEQGRRGGETDIRSLVRSLRQSMGFGAIGGSNEDLGIDMAQKQDDSAADKTRVEQQVKAIADEDEGQESPGEHGSTRPKIDSRDRPSSGSANRESAMSSDQPGQHGIVMRLGQSRDIFGQGHEEAPQNSASSVDLAVGVHTPLSAALAEDRSSSWDGDASSLSSTNQESDLRDWMEGGPPSIGSRAHAQRIAEAAIGQSGSQACKGGVRATDVSPSSADEVARSSKSRPIVPSSKPGGVARDQRRRQRMARTTTRVQLRSAGSAGHDQEGIHTAEYMENDDEKQRQVLLSQSRSQGATAREPLDEDGTHGGTFHGSDGRQTSAGAGAGVYPGASAANGSGLRFLPRRSLASHSMIAVESAIQTELQVMRHSDGFTEGTIIRSSLPHPARAVWGSVSSAHEGAQWELDSIRRRRRRRAGDAGAGASNAGAGAGLGTGSVKGQGDGDGGQVGEWVFEQEGCLPPTAYVLATAVASLEREWREEYLQAGEQRRRRELRDRLPDFQGAFATSRRRMQEAMPSAMTQARAKEAISGAWRQGRFYFGVGWSAVQEKASSVGEALVRRLRQRDAQHDKRGRTDTDAGTGTVHSSVREQNK